MCLQTAGPFSQPALEQQKPCFRRPRLFHACDATLPCRGAGTSACISRRCAQTALVQCRNELTGAGIHILTHTSAPCCCRDQRVYKQAVGADGAFSAPEPLTGADSQHRYADAVIDKRFDRLVAVREDHSGEGEPVNSVAAVGAQS